MNKKEELKKLVNHKLGAVRLLGKWLPRKGLKAVELRNFLGLTPKQYRKVLVRLTDVVETKMCSKEWDKINYEHVPSLAQARYSKAFLRHDETRYRDYGARAAKQEVNPETGKVTKINAGAVYPYDVLKNIVVTNYYFDTKAFDPNIVRAQWDALPNYMGDKNILPIVDVSGSMTSKVGGNSSLTCMNVAISLGLYMATKNKGDFNNIFMTFSGRPELVTLKGNDIVAQIQQMSQSHWGMNTNLSAAFQNILSFAVNNNVPSKDMPEYLVVFSDMEFDRAASGKTAYEDYRNQFANAGYEAPKIIWWNIQARHDNNVPVKYNQYGTGLVSGFSPTIAKNIMSGKQITPYDMMINTIMDKRYDIELVA